MKKEIERKFLVNHAKLPTILNWELVKQGYLSFDPQVRVRVWRGGGALTIKSKGTKIRDEWEYKIPIADADGLLGLCGQYVIEKDRSLVWVANKEWSIDRFHGKHEGLVTAEVELERENESVELPAWVKQEVTGDEQYLNINLVRSKRVAKN